MSRLTIVLLVLTLSTLIYGLGKDGKKLRLTRISTQFNYPVGCGYHEPTGSLITTANYPSGNPHNFRRVDATGNQFPFSGISGLTDEVKLGTARAGNTAGFTAGDLFGGTGVSGHIIRITNNGNTWFNPWCQLGDVGLMRGSLYVDDIGVFDGKLVVVTTSGYVFTVDSNCQSPTQIGFFNTHLEGLALVPNDPNRYGRLAGRAVIGAEQQNKIYTIDKNGAWEAFDCGFGVEDVDLIVAGENFFGINYGTGWILGANYTQYQDNYGDIMLTSESGVQYILTWENGAPLYSKVVYDDQTAPIVAQWEHVTFSPGGVCEIPPADFSLCMRASSGGNTVEPAQAVKLDGALTAVANYRYGNGKTDVIKPPASAMVADAVNIFITQDFCTRFGLTIITGTAGGAVTLLVRGTNIGTTALVSLQDDPAGGADTGDSWSWDPSSGSGRFGLSWAAGSTDGAVIDPLSFVTVAQRFSFEFTVDSSQPRSGVNNWVFHYYDTNGALQKMTVPITQPFKLDRVSCSCGNGRVDKWEDCDGGECCDQCVFRPPSYKCKPSTGGACDVDDFCSGSSSTCTDTFRSSSFLCRDSAGVCDVQEFCSGGSPNCPADSRVPTGTLCRASAGQCDAEEVCDGSSPNCPANSLKPNDTPCDDGNNCTTTDVCKNGVCAGVDTLCGGNCGDGILAQSEECDLGANNDCNTGCCCNCKFNLKTVQCRASTGLCDPAELCTGTSGDCPVDINSRCPICDKNCSSPNGNCVADGVCICLPGFTGPDCSTPVCDYFANCSSCAAVTGCNWCCSAGRCQSTAESASCAKVLTQPKCECEPACKNGGVCDCGVCTCPPSFTGPDCGLILGCDNNTYSVNDTNIPTLDKCNICGGNNTACIGCDGQPSLPPLEYDRCGVCGGIGDTCFDICPYKKCGECALAENCVWCDSDQTCVPKAVRDKGQVVCEKFIENKDDCEFLGLTVAEAATVGAGVIAGIAIAGAVAAGISIFAGKKGYDAYMRNKNNMNGAQSNPMYNDGGRTGQNPMYEMK